MNIKNVQFFFLSSFGDSYNYNIVIGNVHNNTVLNIILAVI